MELSALSPSQGLSDPPGLRVHWESGLTLSHGLLFQKQPGHLQEKFPFLLPFLGMVGTGHRDFYIHEFPDEVHIAVLVMFQKVSLIRPVLVILDRWGKLSDTIYF